MPLPLVHFRRPSTCPLPLNKTLFNILYASAASDSQRQQVGDSYQSGRMAAYELAQAVSESKDGHPLKPWTRFSSPELSHGEVVAVPSRLCNPEMYVWMQNKSGGTYLPAFLKFQHDEWFAAHAFDALLRLELALDRFCMPGGFKRYTGAYETGELWMLFSNRVKQDDFPEEMPMAERKAIIQAVGDFLLPYAAVENWDQVYAAITMGIDYYESRLKRMREAANA